MKADKLRMVTWILLCIAFYCLAWMFVDNHQLSTALWKAGDVTGGGYLGYWIDRHCFGRVDDCSSESRLIVRAIVMAASIMGLSLGL